MVVKAIAAAIALAMLLPMPGCMLGNGKAESIDGSSKAGGQAAVNIEAAGDDDAALEKLVSIGEYEINVSEHFAKSDAARNALPVNGCVLERSWDADGYVGIEWMSLSRFNGMSADEVEAKLVSSATSAAKASANAVEARPMAIEVGGSELSAIFQVSEVQGESGLSNSVTLSVIIPSGDGVHVLKMHGSGTTVDEMAAGASSLITKVGE